VADIQQRPVLDIAIEAKLVEKAINGAPTELQGKIEPEKELEAPASGSFSVDIPLKESSGFGLEVDKACELGPMITAVDKSGAIQAFNELHPLAALKAFDIITSIDGVKGADNIFQKMHGAKTEGSLKMTMLRPRRVELSLSKTDSLGLKLDFGSSSVGAVVREIGRGLVATWNAKNSSSAVGENDRVLEVNGEQHFGDDLLAAIQAIGKDTKFSLTVLKY